MNIKRWWWAAVIPVALLAIYFLAPGDGSCTKQGVWFAKCPSGKLRQTVHVTATNMQRGKKLGTITVWARAHYTLQDSDQAQQTDVKKYKVALSLVDPKGHARALKPHKKWQREGTHMIAQVALGDGPDGDYVVRAEVTSGIGKDTVDLPLALYSPAQIHVITDRPLYEPGNHVQFRAAVLRARDFAPLDSRPGTWKVLNPSGTVLLEERAPAGPWGVVAGSFPLDSEAAHGQWRVQWVSGGTTGEVPFTVAPFTLPRFAIEARASRPFYRAGDTPKVAGTVKYSSGAPVDGANVAVTWRVQGTWPPPTSWKEGGLPKAATTGPGGTFKLTLPEVPTDLSGQVTLVGQLAAVDAAGDRIQGTVQLLLSADAIKVSAVTELNEGLVKGANNRIYLRVTNPDGTPLPGANITVKRAWDPQDEGVAATLDEDSVARVQVNPGQPVNITIPPLPWRPPPKRATVRAAGITELISGRSPALADQIEMDRWLAPLGPCARWVADSDLSLQVGVMVDTTGRVLSITSGAGDLDRCVAQTLRGKRLPAGKKRLYRLSYRFSPPDLAKIHTDVASVHTVPEGLSEHVRRISALSRDCVPLASTEGRLPMAWSWRVDKGDKAVTANWIHDGSGGSAQAALACVQANTTRLVLTDPAPAAGVGLVRFRVELPARIKRVKPRARVMLGYELLVTASNANTTIGHTKLRLTPGSVPDMRLRATPVLPTVGDTVRIDLLRGPNFTGTLPKELRVVYLKGQLKDVKVNAPKNVDDDEGPPHATFKVTPDMQGWTEVFAGSTRTLVYVAPVGSLAVTVASEKPQYKPGQKATLNIHTTAGNQPVSAAVGLFGVDQSLAQLTALPGPQDMDRIRPKVTTSAPAFGILDGQALAMGRVRGANAAAATVVRVTAIPKDKHLDAVLSAEAATNFDAVAELTDTFYNLLAELHVQARTWEAAAPANHKMTNKRMTELWDKTLDSAKAKGQSIVDSFGRTLRLSQLPSDLLALTDPRAVIINTKRFTEDVENWANWVAKNRP